MSSIGPQSATLANVNGSASSVAVFAAKGASRGRSVWNDSTATLYLKFGTTASTTSFTVKMGPGDFYEFPQPTYAGVVEGIWSAANGAARTSEW